MAGRPTKLTAEVRKKIEEAAAIGASDTEIALYADITRQTYYNWIKEDKELFDRIEELRERPFLKARQTVVKDLEDPSGARWYLERKKSSEFSAKSNVDIDIKLGGEKLTKQGEVFKTAIKSGLRGRGHSKVDTRKPNSNGDK